MTATKIITDSTSDIPPALAKKYDIEIIPLYVYFGEEKYKVGVDLTATEFYKKMANKKNPWPSTEPPSVLDFFELYSQASSDGYDKIISIHITPNMSETMRNAEMAKMQMPDVDITVVDSNTVTIPFGMIVCEAAKAVQEGYSKEEVLTLLREMLIPNAQICGVIDTLENLQRGGRIGRAQSMVGRLLNLKPLMQITDGEVDSFGRIRGHKEAFNRMVELAPVVFGNIITNSVWIGYTDSDNYSKALYDAIVELPNAPKELELVEIGPTVGTHLGPGVMAFSWLGLWNEQWFFGKK